MKPSEAFGTFNVEIFEGKDFDKRDLSRKLLNLSRNERISDHPNYYLFKIVLNLFVNHIVHLLNVIINLEEIIEKLESNT
ncbi:MAG: hypothetical protein ACTSVE_02670, partial [Candidatus Helarchaeota archaeon]